VSRGVGSNGTAGGARRAVVLVDVKASGAMANAPAELEALVREATRRHLARGEIAVQYAVTAGDEFQTLATSLADVPSLVFDLRILFGPVKLWVAIGHGTIESMPSVDARLNEVGFGEAFRLAREAMTELKADQKRRKSKYPILTRFRSSDAWLSDLLNVVLRLHDTLLVEATPRQWETIGAYYRAGSLEGAALELGIDGSTVSRNLARGHFWQMRDSMEGLREVLKGLHP